MLVYKRGPHRKLPFSVQGTALTCPSCGYGWRYSALSEKDIRCPNCHARVNLKRLGIVLQWREELESLQKRGKERLWPYGEVSARPSPPEMTLVDTATPRPRPPEVTLVCTATCYHCGGRWELPKRVKRYLRCPECVQSVRRDLFKIQLTGRLR